MIWLHLLLGGILGLLTYAAWRQAKKEDQERRRR